MCRKALALSGLLLLSGCLYNARERADQAVCDIASKPFDLAPTPPAQTKDVQTTALTQGIAAAQQPAKDKPKIEPKIPSQVPGSETPLLPKPPEDPVAKQKQRDQVYPALPPLPDEPAAKPGPDGRPYTLAALQQLAAANSPQLRQAAADVETARGNLIQARAYPNPTVGWNVEPSNDGSTAGVQGPFIDQKILVSGKLKLASAAAEMDLRNAELALKRARSDLATLVRNAYFAVLVAKETVRVNKAFARFTDDIYRLHILGQLGIGAAALYEPAALRAQAYTTRLAYKQAIQTYEYSWKQLVAAVGLRQLPLTEVAGRIDAVIPYYDYDTVLAYALQNHTDVLTAGNALEKARYNLKSAQVTPVPDFDFNISFLKEYALTPRQFVHTATIGFPLPIWDQNRGAIMAAEGALVRATEGPHRVELSLTSALAIAYMGYKQNLDALEYYRRHILPDQVRFYRGVLDRRQVDINAQFNDLVTAQQTLGANVASYLSVLSSLWSSVVSVADLLQTDDLFQLATPKELPPLPDLDKLPAWPCCHDCLPSAAHPHGECNRIQD